MPKTFRDLAAAALLAVDGITPQQARARLAHDPTALLIDVLDLADRRALGQPEGAVPISAGMLALRADRDLPDFMVDARLQDRARPLILIDDWGPLAAIGAQTLQEMGFRDVAYICGGRTAWCAAKLPLIPPSDG